MMSSPQVTFIFILLGQHHTLQGLPQAVVQVPGNLQNAEAWDCRNSSSQVCKELGGQQCSQETGRCRCPDNKPVFTEGGCQPAYTLDSACSEHSDCSSAFCRHGVCACSRGMERKAKNNGEIHCIVVREDATAYQVPTAVGLGVGLSGLTAFLCFTLKLFSKARTVQTRGYGDASVPPTITLEGKDLGGEEEEQWSRASSKSRIYTPGHPLTPSQVRRMSELSTVSVKVQDKDFTVRPVSPMYGSEDLLFKDGESVEQQLTIIPRLTNKRRGSIADHAFPELHQKGRNHGESSALLILTQTRTDGQGRRHSVAVPLLNPPNASPAQNLNGLQIERKTPLVSQNSLGKSRLGRRHSLQVATTGRPPSRSPSRKGSCRRNRRPSKQGLYQFLDQAISH